MSLYKNIDQAKDLKFNQLVLCKCPEWNEEGFQIATWNGNEFEYSMQSNELFNSLVVSFMVLNKNGEPK